MTKEFKNKATPLMVMLNDRKAWNAPHHQRPVFTPAEKAEITKLVQRYAAVHASDPNAGARIRSYLMKGLISMANVREDLDRITPS